VRLSTSTPAPFLELDPMPNPAQAYFKAGQLAYIGTGVINAIDWSPDGRLLALATSRGIQLLDAVTFDEVRFIDVNAWINEVVFSPDGQWLASNYYSAFGESRSIAIWNVESGNPAAFLGRKIIVRSVRGRWPPMLPGPSLVFAPDGESLAFRTRIEGFTGRDSIQLWSIPDARLINIWFEDERDHFSGLTSSNLPKTKHWLVDIRWDYGAGDELISQDQSFSISHETDNKRAWVRVRAADGSFSYLLGDESFVRDITIRDNGSQFATLTAADELKIWDTATGQLVRWRARPELDVDLLAISPDGKELATAGNRSVQFYDTQTGELLRRIPSPIPMRLVIYSPAENYMAGLLGNSGVIIFDPSTGETLRTLYTPATEVSLSSYRSTSGLMFSKDGGYLFGFYSGWDDGYLRVWRTADWALIHSGAGRHISALHPDGASFLIRLHNRDFAAFEYATGRQLVVFEESQGASHLNYSTDGRLLFGIEYAYGQVSIWDAFTGKRIALVNPNELKGEGPYDAYIRLAFSESAGILAAIQYYSQIRLYDMNDWHLLSTINTPGGIWDLVLDRSGQILAARGPGVLYIWQLDYSDWD
jgi:WD40 repeat protein